MEEKIKEIVRFEIKSNEMLQDLLKKVDKLYFSGRSFKESISIVTKEEI